MNEIICGESILELKKMSDNSVDCIITSPPYWKGFGYEAYFNSYNQYLKWCNEWIVECKRVLKPDGTFWLNVINDSEININNINQESFCKTRSALLLMGAPPRKGIEYPPLIITSGGHRKTRVKKRESRKKNKKKKKRKTKVKRK